MNTVATALTDFNSTGSPPARELNQPIAIVGIGCRFPGGASSPKAFWNLLTRGKDAIADVPSDRWDLRRFYDPDPAKPGKMHVKQGGFLKEKLDHFDPLFFGISPREAESMDPQQRLLLEVTWEAFEDAGIIADALAGSRTGVFIGGFCLDNMLTRLSPLNRDLADSHTAANSTMTILSNRISYVFDLRGPSVTMDTACSSSLVATHYACQSLWNGEATIALAGGVNTMFRPEFPIAMSKGKFLSQHGRCKTFDEEAAGYARGEGAGIVVLKPLSEARRDGDRVYGLIRATGVNQDGQTPGLSMPNAESQQALIRHVYQQAKVEPSSIGYIEAHGTGTQVGDFAETQALHNALARGRPADRKCFVGSVKTNIGHTEAAAGIAGLIKATLALHHEKIPPNLHFNKANPKIPFDSLCLQVPQRTEAWQRADGPRYAGVNSFGYGGTNAHALLEEAPAPLAEDDAPEPAEASRPYLIPLSARSEPALREVAAKFAFHLTTCRTAKSFADFCFTASLRRSSHHHRASVLADSPQALRKALQQLSSGETPEQACVDTAERHRTSPLVFIYTGMGPQWAGMGQELYETEGVFRQALEEFDTIFASVSNWSILKEMKADPARSRMENTEVAQPANFALQFALTALWKSWGVEPDAVIGHSVGEVASAYASGALSLDEAARVSYHRSRLQQTVASQGSMLAVGLSEAEAEKRIADLKGVSIAAINSPSGVTLSGDSTELRRLAELLQQEAIFNRQLSVEVAYHSPQMDPLQQELLSALSSLNARTPKIPIYSTVTGEEVSEHLLDATYWWNNVRQPVRFAQGIQALLKTKRTRFLEVGPHPVLGHSVREIAAATGSQVRLTPSLHRKQAERARMLESLGQLYTQGQEIHWSAVIPQGGAFVSIPTYPWQRERYWKESAASIEDRLGSDRPVFLSNRMSGPQPSWTVELNEQYFPFLNEHKVNGDIVFPGAGYIEAALELCQHHLDQEAIMLRDLAFESMLPIEADRVQELSTAYDPESHRFLIHSRVREDDAEWQRHASGLASIAEVRPTQSAVDLSALRQRFRSESSVEEMYASLERRGLDYGPSFRRALSLFSQDNEVLVRVGNPDDQGSEMLPVCALDTAFHSLLSIVPGTLPWVPISASQLAFHSRPGPEFWFHGVITRQDERSLHANLRLIGDDGAVLLEVKDAFMMALPKAGARDGRSYQDCLYAPTWTDAGVAAASTAPATARTYLVFGDESPFTRGLLQHLDAEGHSYALITRGTGYRHVAANHLQVSDQAPGDLERAFDALARQDWERALYLWPVLEATGESKLDDAISHSSRVLRIARALAKDASTARSVLLVTRGAQTIKGDEGLDGLAASPLWGVASVVENELEHVRCHLFDLDPNAAVEEAPPWNLLLGESLADQALRSNHLYARKLRRYSLPDTTRAETVACSEPLTVKRSDDGSRSEPRFRRSSRSSPKGGQIEIRTDYVRLRPKYVSKLKAQGRPAHAETIRSNDLGWMEMAGTVVEVGDGVEGVQIGDCVVAASPDGPSTYITVAWEHALPIPGGVPTNGYFVRSDFLPAYYALKEIARLKAGETALITDAASGIGMAAIQVAHSLGAHVIGMVDSPDKRERLERLPLDKTVDSGAQAFAGELDKLATDKGVDVILNTLPGEPLRQVLQGAAPFARIVDLGYRDGGASSSAIPLPARSNISITRIDTDALLVQRPALASGLLDEIRDGFAQGSFQPVNSLVYPAKDLAMALEAVASDAAPAVLRLRDEQVETATDGSDDSGRFEGGAYLITGGNSGFGLQVARWLAENGAAKIILVSRSGARSDEALSAIENISQRGVEVRSEAVDVTAANQVAALIRRAATEGPPLRGVFHGAMTLDDALIEELDDTRLRKVMEPKIAGALNLYHELKDTPLDFFVSFSSISSLIGNRGQANYVAANAFLDAFAHATRTSGFPAVTINWGALAESGVITRNERVGEILEQSGIHGLSNRRALDALGAVLRAAPAQVGVFDVDWSKWAKASPRTAASFAFSELAQPAANEEGGKARALLQELAELDPANHRNHIEKRAVAGFCKVLKIPQDRIDLGQTLNSLGIDSLLLLELALTIQAEFGIRITAAELARHPTIRDLSEFILSRLGQLPISAA